MFRTKLFTLGLALSLVPPLFALDYPEDEGQKRSDFFRSECMESRSSIDLDINNVRARLRSAGDMWWDGTQARYIVPKVAEGEIERSSSSATALWLSAFDDGGNLYTAAQTYRSTGIDFWSGPIYEQIPNERSLVICQNWDKFFPVYGSEIDALRSDFLEPDANGQADFRIDREIARNILGWPGRGNPHFAAVHGFELPDQDLAPFIEPPGREDGIYDPYQGDHPILDVRGCEQNYFNPHYADQMIWWVFNDIGNVHTHSNGQPLRVEIQSMAFAYKASNAINDATFYKQKVLNRGSQRLRDAYVSIWTDNDLGNPLDDFAGVDTSRNFSFFYNADDEDEDYSPANIPGYGRRIPALGIDILRGPLNTQGQDIGLTGFMPIYTGGCCSTPRSPSGYRALQGSFFTDGIALTNAGNGYNSGGIPTKYAFYSLPNDTGVDAWSMCSVFTDSMIIPELNFLHNMGPFEMLPGSANEILYGAVWVPELPDYPCPSMAELLEADDLIQSFFDNCFELIDGPDAPYMDIIELENELVLNMLYSREQNNYELGYEESSWLLAGQSDSLYRFQGLKVYQVKDPNISPEELEDLNKARLIFQRDVEDSIERIVNWYSHSDPSINISTPQVMVEGENKGMELSFQVRENAFAGQGEKLINHQPYYFCVVAYAHNEHERYNPATNAGQAEPYLQGKRNFRIYTGIPRPNAPEYDGIALNAAYGDGPEITRIEGKGHGSGLFLDLADAPASEEQLLAQNRLETMRYSPRKGPVDIKVINPLRVPKGTFHLYISDEDYLWQRTTDANGQVRLSPQPPNTAGSLEGKALRWTLIDLEDNTQFWTSEQGLERKNEYLIEELGISLSFKQEEKPGTAGLSGFLGVKLEYQNSDPWYRGIEDSESGLFNFLRTRFGESDEDLDPQSDFTRSEGGWHPVQLSACEFPSDEYYFSSYQIGGDACDIARQNNRGQLLNNLRNVNVVLSPDKSTWSRCIVLESATAYHSDPNRLNLPIPSGLGQLGWKRNSPSRDKDGNTEAGSTGMSWFPGYAYDVETGERLNILFSENSIYNGTMFDQNLFPAASTGDDMLYNPSSLAVALPPNGFLRSNEEQYLASILGGQHTIYVANSGYDSCQSIINEYERGFTGPLSPVYRLLNKKEFLWASMGYLAEGQSMRNSAGAPDFKGNTPPSELRVKLRVNRPFEREQGQGSNAGYPLYEFSLDGLAAQKEQKDQAQAALDLMAIVPNPYYAYSDYEANAQEHLVKIANIPARCHIRIYSIDGRFVREYKVERDYPDQVRNGPARFGSLGQDEQILTSINWDLKNSSGVPVGSGVYLVHIVVPELGERVLKSFVVNRKESIVKQK